MSNSNKMFGDLAKATEKPEKERKRSSGFLEGRANALSDLASGAVETKSQRWVDPDRCRMWTHHNRRYDLLNQSRCQDLIDGIIAQGKQEFPAIVRKVDGDPKFDFEVICGARRHWAISWLRENNYPQFKLLVEVRTLTDEEAFRLSDVENRDRLDICDYERACDYQQALKSFYPTQKEMAKRLEVSEAWLSRYLDVAALPKDVVDAFGDVTLIRLKSAMDLKPALKDRHKRPRVIESARALVKEQGQRLKSGQTPLEAHVVVKRLLTTIRPKAKAAQMPVVEYKGKDGLVCLTAKRRGKWGIQLNLSPGKNDKAALLKACKKAIDDLVSD